MRLFIEVKIADHQHEMGQIIFTFPAAVVGVDLVLPDLEFFREELSLTGILRKKREHNKIFVVTPHTHILLLP